MNSIKYKFFFFYILWVLMSLWSMPSASAQYLRLSLEMEAELGAGNVQALDFSTLSSGLKEIRLGDSGMAVFRFSGYHDVNITVKINKIVYLTRSGNQSGDRLVLELIAAYANQGENDYRQAIAIAGNEARFRISEREMGGRRPGSRIETAWLYIYGTIDVEQAVTGRYEGNAIVRIEYE